MEPRLSASRIEPIETLRVGYRHRRAFTVEATGSGDAICYMWVYAEALTIDRETQTVSLQRQWNENVDTTTQYHIAGGVSPLLDECTGYFLDWEAKETDADAPRDCEIDILYQSGARRTWRVSYERAALPEGWEDFLDDVRTLIAPYGKSELFNPLLRARGVREGEYIYCSVSFQPYEKTYYYRTDDDTLRPGDWVIVPAGAKNRETRVRVEEVEYFRENELPMPLERVKRVLRRCEH